VATGKIQKRAVDALQATGEKQFLWDEDLRGFGVQVTPAGAKSYVYQYRLGGRESPKRRYTIGRHGSPWTPATARAECERLALMVGQGIDPTHSVREQRRQAVDLAFTAYVDTFAQGYLKKHWKDWARTERLLRREPAEILRDKPIPAVKRSDIIAILDRFEDRPAMARQVYATLRRMFAWAEGRGEIERSPIGLGFPAPRPIEARARTLTDEELTLLWDASGKIGHPFGPAYRLLLSTAGRREEVAALNWNELDRGAREWVLPPERAKNGQAHIIPLNDLALSILDEIASVTLDHDAPTWPKTGLVFTTTGKTPVSGHSKAKRRLDEEMRRIAQDRAAGRALANIAPWRVHDIRRTVATGLQRLGVRFEVTEAVLNHVSGSRSGVAGVYQRHSWKEEKRSALDAWARQLQAMLAPASGCNVLHLAERAKA
jgi:integrase